MPPLTHPRQRRLARGLLASSVGMTAALGGPVAPAGAGAPAGHTTEAASSAVVSNPASSLNPLVTDRLGTHTGDLLTPAPVGSKADPSASKAGECDVSLVGLKPTLTLKLGSTWTALAIRTKPCTSGTQVGIYGTLTSFSSSSYTKGQFICRGRTYGYGTAAWYKTSRGFVWAGGTNFPRWDPDRPC